MTAIGRVELARAYFVCPQCRDSGCPLDERLGLDDSVSPEALRLIVLAVIETSMFASAWESG